MAFAFSPAVKSLLECHNVHVLGTGPTTLLFCNGYNCSQDIWHYLVPALSANYRVVLFDQVGINETCWDSYDPSKYGTLHGHAQDVVAICQALELQQVTIIGHSEGAMVALLAANRAPEHFARVVLIAATPCHLNLPGYYGGFETTDVLELLASMAPNYQSWATALAFMLMGEGQPARLGHELATHFCLADPHIARRTTYAAFLSDHRTDLQYLTLPTLLLQCADDVAVPAEVNAYMLAQLPHATLTLLPTTGHCPHLSVPLQVLAALQAFLTEPLPARQP
jgi:sigma-B regulation protein RsbQ